MNYWIKFWQFVGSWVGYLVFKYAVALAFLVVLWLLLDLSIHQMPR